MPTGTTLKSTGFAGLMRLACSQIECLNVLTKHLRGWWPTDSSWVPPNLRSYGVHQPAVNIRSQLTSSDRQHYSACGISSPRPRGLPGRGCHYESACYCDRQSVFLGAATDTKCATFPTTPRHALLTLIRALVVTKVDYCNWVLAGAPGHLLGRLQSVQNAAARLIFAARKREHITPLLHELHWLRVPESI